MVFVGHRETVEIVDFVGFVVFGGYRETVEIVDSVAIVGAAGCRKLRVSFPKTALKRPRWPIRPAGGRMGA